MIVTERNHLTTILRQVLLTKDGQPFLVAGSGTLGWDMVRRIPCLCRDPADSVKVAANLVEPGEDVLVVNSGYFGDSFAEWSADLILLCGLGVIITL